MPLTHVTCRKQNGLTNQRCCLSKHYNTDIYVSYQECKSAGYQVQSLQYLGDKRNKTREANLLASLQYMVKFYHAKLAVS